MAASARDWESQTVKLVVVGEPGVGKTTLLQRVTIDSFAPPPMTNIGIDFALKRVTTASGSQVKLQIWDTAGQERFRSLSRMYYRGTHVVLACYDTSRRDSFEALRDRWLPQIAEFATDDTAVMIVGLKCDLAAPPVYVAKPAPKPKPDERKDNHDTSIPPLSQTTQLTALPTTSHAGASGSCEPPSHSGKKTKKATVRARPIAVATRVADTWDDAEEVGAFCKEVLGAPVYRTSAKTRVGIDELIQAAATRAAEVSEHRRLAAYRAPVRPCAAAPSRAGGNPCMCAGGGFVDDDGRRLAAK